MLRYGDFLSKVLSDPEIAAITVVPVDNPRPGEMHLVAWVLPSTPARDLVARHPDPDVRAKFVVLAAIDLHERCEMAGITDPI